MNLQRVNRQEVRRSEAEYSLRCIVSSYLFSVYKLKIVSNLIIVYINK